MKDKKHAALFAILALSMLFVSCDKNNGWVDNELSGEAIPVWIHSLEMAGGGLEDITRSFSQKGSEIVSTPVGNGLLLEMNMERDTSLLRLGSLQTMENGKMFRVIAVEAGTTKYYSHGDFTVGGDRSLTSFHVQVGSTYDFICISYNTTALPSTTGYTKGSSLPTLNVDNTKDVLWWKQTDVTIHTVADVALEIKLKQLLTKVKVAVDCSYNGWKITGVGGNITLGSVAISGTINWSAGTINPGSAAARRLTWSSITANATLQTSNVLTIMPVTNVATITVSIPANAISRSGLAAIPTGAATGTFSTALSAGFNYTLRVRLRAPAFAGSNIYWDTVNQRLTFEVEGATTNEGRQGVFFRWGSLIGISPAQTGSSNAFSASTPIYVPVVKDPLNTSTWKATTGAAMAADGNFPSVSSNYNTWTQTVSGSAAPGTDIPYLDGRYAITDFSRNGTFMMDDERNTTTMYQSFQGDICQYLSTKTGVVSGDYRMPTSNEFGTSGSAVWNGSNPVAGGWMKGSGSFSYAYNAGNPYGSADLLKSSGNNANMVLGSAINQMVSNVVFPASGYRHGSNGNLTDVGYDGDYWSSSSDNSINGYGLYFSLLEVYPNDVNNNYHSCAFAVRCVKN